MSDYSRRMGDLLLAGARAQGQARQTSADAWGTAIQGAAQVPGAVLQDRDAQRLRQATAQRQAQLDTEKRTTDAATAAREDARLGLEGMRYRDERDRANHQQAVTEATHLRDAGATPESVMDWVRSRTGTLWGPEQGGPMLEIASTPEGAQHILESLAGPKPPVKLEAVDPTNDLRNPITGEIVSKGVAKPVTFGAPTAAMVDGKRVFVRTGSDGKTYDMSGHPVTSEPTPIPRPAAGNATSAALTDDGVEFAATQYRLTGKMPSLGNGAGDVKAKIISGAAAQAKTLGQTPVAAIQKQAAYAGDTKALAKMQAMSASAEAFETKAISQIDIVRDLSNKVGRSQYPTLNKAIVAGKADFLGDSNAQLLYNAITTFSAEYAKIMEGSTGSAAGSSDSSRAAAQRLISAKLNKGTLSDTLDLMKREMDLTLQGYDATIAHINERMTGAPTTATTIRAIDPQGNVHEAPTGTALPAGWKLQ